MAGADAIAEAVAGAMSQVVYWHPCAGGGRGRQRDGGLVNGNDFDGHMINATNLTGGMST
ncbi:hypothetical protein [Sagittula marina]|nr:hypothetical protein [Sagittula marina]